MVKNDIFPEGKNMVNVKDGMIDLQTLEMKDILNMDDVQRFLDNFAVGINCAAVAVDRNGNELTRPSCYRPFCQDFIHKSSIGDARCADCHKRFGEEAGKIGKPYVGTCHAGMIDFAAPVIVKGELIGTILGGQILDREPDENKIRNVAGEINADPDELIEAAHKADIVPRKNIEAAAEVLNTVVNGFAVSGYNKLEIRVLVDALSENFKQISQTIENLAESAQTITENQDSLSTEIGGIETTAHDIANIVTSIGKVADRTKMIGLNASIEAARLGNDGRSFSVVAKEIRNLAENTKQTAGQITLLNEQISDKVNGTTAKSKETLAATQDQSAAMEELSATVTNMLSLTDRLTSLFG
jgi:ligand-binding sensor protein